MINSELSTHISLPADANTMRGCTIAYDAIVFALTVLRTQQLQRHSRVKTGLVELIIRDGQDIFAFIRFYNSLSTFIRLPLFHVRICTPTTT